MNVRLVLVKVILFMACVGSATPAQSSMPFYELFFTQDEWFRTYQPIDLPGGVKPRVAFDAALSLPASELATLRLVKQPVERWPGALQSAWHTKAGYDLLASAEGPDHVKFASRLFRILSVPESRSLSVAQDFLAREFQLVLLNLEAHPSDPEVWSTAIFAWETLFYRSSLAEFGFRGGKSVKDGYASWLASSNGALQNPASENETWAILHYACYHDLLKVYRMILKREPARHELRESLIQLELAMDDDDLAVADMEILRAAGRLKASSYETLAQYYAFMAHPNYFSVREHFSQQRESYPKLIAKLDEKYNLKQSMIDFEQGKWTPGLNAEQTWLRIASALLKQNWISDYENFVNLAPIKLREEESYHLLRLEALNLAQQKSWPEIAMALILSPKTIFPAMAKYENSLRVYSAATTEVSHRFPNASELFRHEALVQGQLLMYRLARRYYEADSSKDGLTEKIKEELWHEAIEGLNAFIGRLGNRTRNAGQEHWLQAGAELERLLTIIHQGDLLQKLSESQSNLKPEDLAIVKPLIIEVLAALESTEPDFEGSHASTNRLIAQLRQAALEPNFFEKLAEVGNGIDSILNDPNLKGIDLAWATLDKFLAYRYAIEDRLADQGDLQVAASEIVHQTFALAEVFHELLAPDHPMRQNWNGAFWQIDLSENQARRLGEFLEPYKADEVAWNYLRGQLLLVVNRRTQDENKFAAACHYLAGAAHAMVEPQKQQATTISFLMQRDRLRPYLDQNIAHCLARQGHEDAALFASSAESVESNRERWLALKLDMFAVVYGGEPYKHYDRLVRLFEEVEARQDLDKDLRDVYRKAIAKWLTKISINGASGRNDRYSRVLKDLADIRDITRGDLNLSLKLSDQTGLTLEIDFGSYWYRQPEDVPAH